MTWRYLVFAEPSGDYLGEIELTDVRLGRSLSGPGRLTAALPPGRAPAWLQPWACSVYAEDETGRVRGGGFLTPSGGIQGDQVGIDCVGRSGYPHGLPWTGAPLALVQEDALAIVRRVWAHLQSQPNGGIGVAVDATTSPVRVGEEEENVSFETSTGELVSFPAGPFTINTWSTLDLGRVIDDLARDTPFDYLEHTAWDAAGERLVHRLQLGYPRIGSRREDLRFALGENLAIVPTLTGEDGSYATEVHALGAGTGRTMVRATLTRRSAGVRRVVTYTDKTARSQAALSAAARADLAWRDGEPEVKTVDVIDSPSARLSAIEVGDHIYLEGATDALVLDRWVRVIDIDIDPLTDRGSLNVLEV